MKFGEVATVHAKRSDISEKGQVRRLVDASADVGRDEWARLVVRWRGVTGVRS